MRAEPELHRTRIGLPLVEQNLEHLGDALRADSRADDVFDADFVGLCLVVATELREDSGAGDVDPRLCDAGSAHVE